MAPQCGSSAATPLSPMLGGLPGSSKASKKKRLKPQSSMPQMPWLQNVCAFCRPPVADSYVTVFAAFVSWRAYGSDKDIPVGQPVSPVHISIWLPPETVSMWVKACMMSSKYVCEALLIGVPCQKPNALTSLGSLAGTAPSPFGEGAQKVGLALDHGVGGAVSVHVPGVGGADLEHAVERRPRLAHDGGELRAREVLAVHRLGADGDGVHLLLVR